MWGDSGVPPQGAEARGEAARLVPVLSPCWRGEMGEGWILPQGAQGRRGARGGEGWQDADGRGIPAEVTWPRVRGWRGWEGAGVGADQRGRRSQDPG